MSSTGKIAVVTGSNKGIGYAVVKGLAKQFDGTIYLTARNEKLGLEAVKALEQEGIKVKFHQLDIENCDSINRFAKYMQETHGGLDILVNNAAIAYKQADTTPFPVQAEHTNRINFTGTLNLCSALFPLLRPHARVVNVSSRVGLLKTVPDQDIRNKLNSNDLTTNELIAIIDDFIKLAQTGEHKTKYPNSAYGMSKVGLTALTRIQQRAFDKDSRPDLIVNAMCPGYCKTDMSSHQGFLTAEQGADTIIYLALLAPNATGPKGEFWAERKAFNWSEEKPLF